MCFFTCAAALLLLALALGLVVVPTDGCKLFLTNHVTNLLNNNVYFRLFTNNYTPVAGSVLSSFVEAAFVGYVPQRATGWSAATLIGNNATTTANPITYQNTSGVSQTIYGVFVTDGTAVPGSQTLLYHAERDTGAPVVIPNGGTYVYTPNFQEASMN
jgi:hypothetical protein